MSVALTQRLESLTWASRLQSARDYLGLVAFLDSLPPEELLEGLKA